MKNMSTASYIAHLSVKTFTILFPANRKCCDKSAMKTGTNLTPISKIPESTFNWLLESWGFFFSNTMYLQCLSVH